MEERFSHSKTRNGGIYARSGGSGSSVFVVIEATYTNQHGETVAVDINTIINR